jgi:hypothetical protein
VPPHETLDFLEKSGIQYSSIFVPTRQLLESVLSAFSADATMLLLVKADERFNERMSAYAQRLDANKVASAAALASATESPAPPDFPHMKKP